MNREEYVRKLREGCAYCSCPGIVDLARLGGRATRLEGICESEGDNVNEHSIDAFKDAVSEYYVKLTECARKGAVKLMLHDYRRGVVVTEMSADQCIELMERSPKPVVSVQCSTCGQKIDIAD